MFKRSLKTLLPIASLVFIGLLVGLPSTSLAGDGPSLEKGKTIWNTKKNKCFKCHGVDGKAATKMGKKKQIPDMSSAAWQKANTDDAIKDAVLNGINRKEGKRKIKMKALKKATKDDAESILLFVRSLAAK